MDSRVKNYKDLKIWQHAMDLVTRVYQLTFKYPREETYGLVSQMRRAAVSVASNIAEGFARQSPREYCQFLYHSLGSCAELETQALIAHRLKYLTQEETNELVGEVEVQSKMTMSLVNRLKAVKLGRMSNN